jgi:polysaccharide deacetylase family protein (PEP-CTERM system associated)
MTIDVEDYYSGVGREWMSLDRPPSDAVVRNTARILELFAVCRLKATFFILGEVAEQFPGLVRQILEAGHELGVHGYLHMQVHRVSPEGFRSEVERGKKLLEDIGGVAVTGHRAPAFSITPATRWALDILADVGFQYDSSIYPIAGRRYGWPGFPLDIQRLTLADGRTILEAPLSVAHLGGKALPCCGGGYLRLFPYIYTRWALRQIERRRPAIVYLHPYEFDTAAPPEDFAEATRRAPLKSRLFNARLWLRRGSVWRKFQRLTSEYSFTSLGEIVRHAAEREEQGGTPMVSTRV